MRRRKSDTQASVLDIKSLWKMNPQNLTELYEFDAHQWEKYGEHNRCSICIEGNSIQINERYYF